MADLSGDDKIDTSWEAPRNFSWIIENELAAMGCPESIQHLKFLSYKGLCHLISLSEEYLPPDIKKYTHLNWLLIPIEEFHAPTVKQVVRFIELCQNFRQAGQPVGIHCRMGRGRTGVMAACYLVYFNEISAERAITTVRLSRPGSIETYGQERIVYEFQDLTRTGQFDDMVREIFKCPYNEELDILETEVERKLELNYFRKEELRKELRVLDYNTLHTFRSMVRKHKLMGKYWLK